MLLLNCVAVRLGCADETQNDVCCDDGGVAAELWQTCGI